ncbi:hypothetical protein, partial [Photobacterium aquimaris]
KIMLELDDKTFAFLEMLAVGLELEANDKIDADWKGFNKEKNDFSPAVRALLVNIANSVATGVRRSGSWEREIVDSLTGWQGTYNKMTLADCIKEEVTNE